MREASFLSRNEKKWRKVESILDKNSDLTPDESADLFVELTDDLSYARTHYKHSVSTQYLNSLARGIFQKLTEARREKLDRFLTFWRWEVPMTVYVHRRKLLYSTVFFILCLLIGVVSTHYDDSFPRVVLGDAYVDMTLRNIEDGNPMKVYKDSDSTSMWLQITLNNVSRSELDLHCRYFVFFRDILFSFCEWSNGWGVSIFLRNQRTFEGIFFNDLDPWNNRDFLHRHCRSCRNCAWK